MEKILLLLLPHWAPVVPPSGLSLLKSFLKKNGYHAKTVDANVELELREKYDEYFSLLKEFVPEEKQSVFYNIGNEVWQNHMMAHLNHRDEAQYVELVKMLVYNTFYYTISHEQAKQLNRLVEENYEHLEKYLIHLLEKEKPTLLGISVYNGTVAASLFAFLLTERRFPHIRKVMGGGIFNGMFAENSPNLEYFLKKTKNLIDNIIVGEGELLFLKLLKGEIPASQRIITMKDIGGETLDLSTVDIPDMSDFKLDYYPFLTSYASRSCPFQCSFCSDPVFWGKFRKKDPGQVARELIRASKIYDYQLFVMSDLLMNPMADDLARELIKADASVYWDTHFRVGKEVCDSKNTLLWRRGGLYRVQLGTESGSQRILDIMGKKITVEQIKSAVSALANAGIKTTTYWVIGHPGETEEDFQKTLDLIRELKNDIYQAETNPFWYVPNGQVADEKWFSKKKEIYPPWARELLIIQQWSVDEPPDREERYRRVNRFARHCKKLGIPNPYSTREIHLADQRWKKLHKNAVPAVEEFKKKGVFIDENKRVREIERIQHVIQHDDDWGF